MDSFQQASPQFFKRFVRSFGYLSLALSFGLAEARADGVASPELQKALQDAHANLGNPIYIRVVKLTQEEYDQHSGPNDPAIHQDLFNRHPDQVPAAPSDMTFYKHNGSTLNEGYTQWEDDHGQVNQGDLNLGQVEVWIRTAQGKYAKVFQHPIAGYGGPLGPKFKQGDFQTPEGCYKIKRLKPKEYVRSMEIDYPNKFDMSHKARDVDPGGNIMFHGKVEGETKTIGCLGLGENIEDFYALVSSAIVDGGQKEVDSCIFPFPMDSEKAEENINRIPDAAPGQFDFKAFWRKLKPAYGVIDETGLPPTISFDPGGEYLVNTNLPQPAPNDVLKGFGSAPTCMTCTTGGQ